MRILIAAALLLVMAGCSEKNSETAPSAPDEFFASLTALCAKAFTGRVVSTDEADAAFASEVLVMHVRQCDENQIRIPFHVG